MAAGPCVAIVEWGLIMAGTFRVETWRSENDGDHWYRVVNVENGKEIERSTDGYENRSDRDDMIDALHEGLPVVDLDDDTYEETDR